MSEQDPTKKSNSNYEPIEPSEHPIFPDNLPVPDQRADQETPVERRIRIEWIENFSEG